jgi:phage shock protein C
MSEARLTRSSNDRIIAGVCGGLAAYLEVDSVFVRLAFVVLLLASGIGFPLYIILWIVMPEGSGEPTSSRDVIQKNAEDLGQSVSKGIAGLGRTGTVGVVLILLGTYFVLTQFGFFDWVGGAVFWSLVLIGTGIYFLLRHTQNRV